MLAYLCGLHDWFFVFCEFSLYGDDLLVCIYQLRSVMQPVHMGQGSL